MKHISSHSPRRILLPAAILLLILLPASCSREEDRLRPYDRIPISEWTLGYGVDDGAVVTKAAQSVATENRVTNLYIFLYNSRNQLVRSRSYWVGTTAALGYDDRIYSYSEKQEDGGASSYGFIPEYFDSFDYELLGDGNGLSFYAVANFDNSTKTALDRLVSLEDPGSASELQDLLDITVALSTPGSVDRTQFLMTAAVTGVNLEVEGTGGSATVSSVVVNLPLRRVDAKVTFDIRVNITEAEGDVSFSSMQYRVHQIPTYSYLFGRDKGTAEPNTWDASAGYEDDGYACRYGDVYGSFDTTYNDAPGGNFSFYLQENRPLPDNPITRDAQGDASSLYALRESWEGEPGSAVHGRKFTYAPEYATFVEISGRLEYQRRDDDGVMENVSADVVYIVHLGETSNNPDDPDDPDAVNNYDVRRNVRYIYNVNIKGINDLEVEVQVDAPEERRPGVEGDVTLSTDRQYICDAHYARLLLVLDRESLSDGGWSAGTPMGNTVYDPEAGLIAGSSDYKWVLFAINKHFRTGEGKMVKFPGIQAYDGGVDFFDAFGNARLDSDPEGLRSDIAQDMGNNIETDVGKMTFRQMLQDGQDSDNYYAGIAGSLDDDACLRDVNQLINYVKEHIDDEEFWGDDGSLAVTAFIDEYTYIYDPRIEDYIHPGVSVSEVAETSQDAQRRLLLWKDYVNAPDRVISITPMASTLVSQDGNTTLTNSFISISQTSVKTVYNPANESLTTAWGLERDNETGKLGNNTYLDLAIGSRDNTAADGRNNFLNFWISGVSSNSGSSQYEWTEVMPVMDVGEGESLNGRFNDVYHACITRNRDLNGNNRIDAGEIYWYLAAKDQLSGLWIGQDALDQSAWMYTGDGSEGNHLATSSSFNGRSGDGDFWMLWAEEGSSWGQIGAHENADNNGQYPYTYDYRCIRNLGRDIADEDQSVAHYAVAADEGEESVGGTRQTIYRLDMSRMNPNALRSASDGGGTSPAIPLDNERSQNNEPYTAFYVMSGTAGNMTWNDMIQRIRDNENPCPDGWRVPNQREMLIMISTLTPDHGVYNVSFQSHIGIATTFSFNGTGMYGAGDRLGFMVEPGSGYSNLRLINNGDTYLTLRCVRDVSD